MRWIAALTALASLASAPAARAEPWYRGEAGKRRITHLVLVTTGGALYAISETVAKESLAPDHCRWCNVDLLDDKVRQELVWSNPHRAAVISDGLGFAGSPIIMAGLLGFAAAGAAPEGEATARIVDDIIPLLETTIYSELIVQTVKFSAGRQRPLVHYNTDVNRETTEDDNLSWFSAHATLTFGMAVSAGMVAHRRRYKLEPVIWTTGLTIAATTSYLRIAGDKHFLTDVLAGAAFGTASGLLIPRITHSLPPRIEIVPTGNGLAVLGSF